MGLMPLDPFGSPGKKLPEPEDVFVAWLLAQPANSDLRIAAQSEIARLRRYAGSHAGPKQLSAIFEAFCETLQPKPRLQ